MIYNSLDNRDEIRDALRPLVDAFIRQHEASRVSQFSIPKPEHVAKAVKRFKEKDTIMKLSPKLIKLIDEAGALQRTCKAARDDYDDARKRLHRVLAREVGEDRWALATLYKAGLIHDECNHIDPIELWEQVKDNKVRAAVMEVNLTKAKALLPRKLFNALCKVHENEEAKLYVRALKVTEVKTTARPAVETEPA